MLTKGFEPIQQNEMGHNANDSSQYAVYCKVFANWDTAGSLPTLNLRFSGNSGYYANIGSLDRFVKWAAHENSSALIDLDVSVYNISYVVVRLDPRVDWRFRPGGPAITTKDKHDDIYRNLTHYDASGSPIQDGDDKTTCQMFSFYVGDIVDPGRDDAYNLHLEFLRPSPKKPLKLLVDPDIKNNGGNPPQEIRWKDFQAVRPIHR